MALQSKKLVMVGLGVLQDQPPNEIQPPLADGIHLRWAFEFEQGFPWHGYYLFRRKHFPGNPICLNKVLSAYNPGRLPDNVLDLIICQVFSDKNIILTDDFHDRRQSYVELDLEHRDSLYIKFPQKEPVRYLEVSIGFRHEARKDEFILSRGIDVVAFMDEKTVASTTVYGDVGDIVSVTLEADNISEVRINSGSASLINLCFVRVSDEATKGWEPLPRTESEFPYPMYLPVYHPDYTGTPQTENLEESRELAVQRILYGDPEQFVFSKTIEGKGSVSIDSGSIIAKGSDTQWDSELTGHLIKFEGDVTAYTIMNVISERKLVLSRAYEEPSLNNEPYLISQDKFGQLHDQLIHLVRGGAGSIEMAERSIPISIYTQGLAYIGEDQDRVKGKSTDWTEDLVGLNFQVEQSNEVYTIQSVNSATQLTLDRPFSIFAIGRKYKIFAALSSSNSKEGHRMPKQSPLQLVLLGAMNPAMAQMLGLYWVDQTVERDNAYDYLIVGDHKGYLNGDPEEVLSYLEEVRFSNIDGYIVFNKKMEQAEALRQPDKPMVYALPGGFMYLPKEHKTVDLQNNAGLRWDLGMKDGAILPGNAVMYHVWRTRLANGEEQSLVRGDNNYAPITEKPLIITHSKPKIKNSQTSTIDPLRPPQWPPFPLHFIDRGLDKYSNKDSDLGLEDGWYSYKVSGIDIFGRHSEKSADAEWYQWTPIPDPVPWYYQLPQSYKQIHPSAVHLLDKIPPPPPAGIEVCVLDPADPIVLKDQAYNDWYNQLSEGDKKTRVGLRISWLWTPAHEWQARDIKEFRIYYQTNHLNTLQGKIVSISSISSAEYEIETDIPNTYPANAYMGAKLNSGADSFTITGNNAGSSLTVRVRSDNINNTGKADVVGGSNTVKIYGININKKQIGMKFRLKSAEDSYTVLDVDSTTQVLILDRPYESSIASSQAFEIAEKILHADTPCNVVIPSPYIVGKITNLSQTGSRVITGKNTAWKEYMVGSKFQIQGESESYIIEKVDSKKQQITLDRNYTARQGNDRTYVVTHLLLKDFTLAGNWEQRIGVVSNQEQMMETIRVAQNPDGIELGGNNASVTHNSTVISLNKDDPNKDIPDFSEITLDESSPFAVSLFLEKASSRSSKLYRILKVDNVNKTVIVDKAPNITDTHSVWSIGLPVRKYEKVITAPESFTTSQANPIVYANIGVSAVDDKIHSSDNPKWSDSKYGNNNGNEGRVAGLVTVARVHRIPPDSPVPPPDSEKVYASLPDYHGHAYYTYRWTPKEGLKTHIFRALDDTLFKVDWVRRSKKNNFIDQVDNKDIKFPKDWEPNRRQARVAELNSFVRSGETATVNSNEITLESESDLSKVEARRDFIWLKADTASQRQCYEITSIDTAANTVTIDGKPKFDGNTSGWAIPLYETLSYDALRVLASLPGNELAFTQVTIEALDPKDPDTADRRGPDNPDDFKLDTDNKWCAYIATMDGRSTNRYFYRSIYMDGAHNRSEELSVSSPPVYLCNVIPPRAPVITKVLGGDRQITLRWAPNREKDMKEYWIYRTENKEDARDIRLMGDQPIHKEKVQLGNPITRAAEVEWIDKTVQGFVPYYYRIVAIDDADNVSRPSKFIVARAIDHTPPVLPIWKDIKWVKLDEKGKVYPWEKKLDTYSPAIELHWSVSQPELKCLVQRRLESEKYWTSVSQWLGSENLNKTNEICFYTDEFMSRGDDYIYRIKVTNVAGQESYSAEKLIQKG